MPPLLTTDLKEIPNSATHTQPAMVVVNFAGEPTYIFAWKGQKDPDDVWWSGWGNGGEISGTSTDAAPALAVASVFQGTTLYLAWKVAGGSEVKVLQYNLGGDGFPSDTGKWESLPTKSGRPGNPTVTTDAAPALAVGANSLLYMVWKAPGNDALMAWSVYDGSGWSAAATIPSAKTDTNPALAGWNTSGPGNVLPLCLAWKGANTDGVFWSMFTPGATTLTQNQMTGASTDAAPALTTGLAKSYYVVWKGKGQNTPNFAPLSGETAGTAFTLPQVTTNVGPSAGNWANIAPGDPGDTFNDLILAWKDISGALWRGFWSIVSNPAPFPGAGADFGRTVDEGSNNYIFYRSTKCDLLRKIVVTITVTEDLDCPKGFSFQLNTNTATNSKNYSRCEWQQCGYMLDSSGNLTSWVNNWVNTNHGPVSIDTIGETNSAGQLQNLLHQWPTPTIPAGCTLTVSLGYASDGVTVKSAAFDVVLPEGGGTKSNGIDFASNLALTPAPGLDAADYLAPISVLQLVIVGQDNKADADFKSGAGTITISSEDPLTAGDNRPGCADTSATLEQSNILYGALSASPSVSFVQLFVASGAKN